MNFLEKHYRRWIHKLAFNGQRHPIDPANLEEVFVDSNGLKYYKFKREIDAPYVRFAQLQEYLYQAERKLNKRELKLYLDACKHQIQTVLQNTSHIDKMVGELARLSVIIEDMEILEEQVLHPELMMDIVACLYIREDEDPAIVDDKIHQEKIAQFSKDSQGGLYDFFYKAGLGKYFTGFELLSKDFENLYQFSSAKMETIREKLSRFRSKTNSTTGT